MFNNHSLGLKNCHTIINNIFSFYKIEEHSDVYRITYVLIEEKRKVCFEKVTIFIFTLHFKYAVMEGLAWEGIENYLKQMEI